MKKPEEMTCIISSGLYFGFIIILFRFYIQFSICNMIPVFVFVPVLADLGDRAGFRINLAMFI